MVLSLANFISYDNDLNLAMASARNGVNFGSTGDKVAVYEESAYTDYTTNNPLLLHPNSIKLVRIEKIDRGFDSRYNRTSIQLKIYVSSPTLKTVSDRNSAGDRINFNVRKSIAMTFKTSNLSNKLYNPSFSNKYIFTTANVQWI